MPKRTDIESILVIGSGPIVIGQACEFDYSGAQACKALREEGYRVILVNSNPATIMTDPDIADATYVEPLSADILTKIIEKERPDALLPTLGGQTALNLAMELAESGVLAEFGVEMIGADAEAIATAEDRQRFKDAMIEIGLDVPDSGVAAPPEELVKAKAPKGEQVKAAMEVAREVVGEIGLPVVIRPAYILGGKGTGIASTPEEFERIASNGLDASPITEILIEQSIAGWKEYELELMRDRADNCIIVCSIENLDPMGVHTGDSITVAPAQTLTDREYQIMRDAAFACIRRVGVDTGGCNIQFAIDPATGRVVVIEMNPRVSRSSALASKATGFAIAKIATKLAVGYTLDEIPNDITQKTPASFEPTIDYVVTKVPRWTFEKFPGQRAVLGTQMKSVGEVMAIGRTFQESVQKALRSLEQGRLGLNQPHRPGHRVRLLLRARGAGDARRRLRDHHGQLQPRDMAELAGFGSLGKEGGLSAERPVLVDRFLEDAIEIDVDALFDGTGEVYIGGIMEHIEEAGIHSGDSACAIPPYSLPAETVARIEDHARRIAEALDVQGLINVQFVVRDGEVYVIEANPRASRTVPFVAKAIGIPLVKVASRIMVGATLAELRAEGLLPADSPVGGSLWTVIGDGHVAVKEAVLPFNRFPDADRVLGPEMRSTGEVMGIDRSFGRAFAKSQIAAGDRLPESGQVFFSLADRDKPAGIRAAQQFVKLGFDLVATAGTADAFEAADIPVARRVAKLGIDDLDGAPTAVDLIEAGEIVLVVNSPRGRGPRADGGYIRTAAGVANIPLLTTAAAAIAAAEGMEDWATHDLEVKALQEFHA